MLTDVDESLFSRILVYFVVKISTHLDLGYATGAAKAPPRCSDDSIISTVLIIESLAQPTYFEGRWAGTG